MSVIQEVRINSMNNYGYTESSFIKYLDIIELVSFSAAIDKNYPVQHLINAVHPEPKKTHDFMSGIIKL
jgi:hypothetical protein